MEASQHSLLAACFTLHSINATLAIVPQRGAGLWIIMKDEKAKFQNEAKDFEQKLNVQYLTPGLLRRDLLLVHRNNISNSVCKS
jgi:hypothetical protein